MVDEMPLAALDELPGSLASRRSRRKREIRTAVNLRKMNGYIIQTCLLRKMHTYESRMTENSDCCCAKEEIWLKIHRNEEGIYRAPYSVQDQSDYVDSEKYPERRHQRIYTQFTAEHT